MRCFSVVVALLLLFFPTMDWLVLRWFVSLPALRNGRAGAPFDHDHLRLRAVQNTGTANSIQSILRRSIHIINIKEQSYC
jgi:lipoprotein signal peptidase